jgi:hypothetical protein
LFQHEKIADFRNGRRRRWFTFWARTIKAMGQGSAGRPPGNHPRPSARFFKTEIGAPQNQGGIHVNFH